MRGSLHDLQQGIHVNSKTITHMQNFSKMAIHVAKDLHIYNQENRYVYL